MILTSKTKYAAFAMVAAMAFSLGVIPALQSANAAAGEVYSARTAGSGITHFLAVSDHNVCGTGDVFLESNSYVNPITNAVFVNYDWSQCSGSGNIDISVYKVIFGIDILIAEKLDKTANNGSHLFSISGIKQGMIYKVVIT